MTTTAAGPSIDLLLDINAAFNARDLPRLTALLPYPHRHLRIRPARSPDD